LYVALIPTNERKEKQEKKPNQSLTSSFSVGSDDDRLVVGIGVIHIHVVNQMAQIQILLVSVDVLGNRFPNHLRNLRHQRRVVCRLWIYAVFDYKISRYNQRVVCRVKPQQILSCKLGDVIHFFAIQPVPIATFRRPFGGRMLSIPTRSFDSCTLRL
jgi:hypothetical protein